MNGGLAVANLDRDKKGTERDSVQAKLTACVHQSTKERATDRGRLDDSQMAPMTSSKEKRLVVSFSGLWIAGYIQYGLTAQTRRAAAQQSERAIADEGHANHRGTARGSSEGHLYAPCQSFVMR